jgi:hypothetical protein
MVVVEREGTPKAAGKIGRLFASVFGLSELVRNPHVYIEHTAANRAQSATKNAGDRSAHVGGIF